MTEKRVRIPLVQGFEALEGGYSGRTNEMIVNGFVEKSSDGSMTINKRQAFTLADSLAASGSPQGLAYFNGAAHVVHGDVLYHRTGVGVPIIADGSAWGQRVASFPPWGWQWGARVVSFNDKLWRIGGVFAATGGGVSNVWSSTDGENWQIAVSAAPFGVRYGMGVVVFGGKLWVFGGKGASANLRDVWSSENGIDWVLETPVAAWGGRYHFGHIATNDGIYIVGGENTAADNYGDVWFTNDGKAWSKLVDDTDTAPIYRRARFTMLFFDNKIWCIAGWRNNSSSNLDLNNVCYSKDGVTWVESTAAAFSLARKYGACVVYDNKMWFLSGQNSGSGALSDVYKTSDGATWTLVTGAPDWGARYGHDAVLFKLPASVSSSRFESVWITDGQGAGTPATIYSATLNVTPPASESLSVSTANERVRFAVMNNGQYLVFKNLHRIWVYGGNAVKLVDSPNVPKQMADGIAVLDGYVFVMDQQGVIYNSKLANPYEWNSLDYLTAEYAQDEGRYLTRYLNFVVAFKSKTIQFFQDVGNPLGSPLAPMLNNTIEIGLAYTGSVANVGNSLFFIGGDRGSVQVYTLDGFQPRAVSTPPVERALATLTNQLVCGMACHSRGHLYYIISSVGGDLFGGLGFTLAYDVTMNMWYRWKGGTFGTMNLFDSVQVSKTNTYFLSVLGSYLYSLDDSSVNCSETSSNLGDIEMQVTTGSYDFGSNKRKFLHRIELISDQTSLSTSTQIGIQKDNNLASSYTVTVDESSHQPAAWRLGAGRKFAFTVTETSDTSIRWKALELDIEEGDG